MPWKAEKRVWVHQIVQWRAQLGSSRISAWPMAAFSGTSVSVVEVARLRVTCSVRAPLN